jgi:DNA-binding XRE family transcriptional regulator
MTANSNREVREQRLAAGLTEEQLARLAQCSTSSVKLIERGWQASPQLGERIHRALARALTKREEVI